MSNYNDKAQVAVAASPMHSFPMHQSCITTGNFMQFDPIFCREIPKGKIKMNHQNFMRSMPMRRPLMGSLQIHNSYFFVPMRTIWEPWSDFKEDVPHNQPNGTGIIANVPLVLNATLRKILATSEYSTEITQEGAAYDFLVPQADNSNAYYAFTAKGRHTYKMLVALGYKVDFTYDSETLSYNALPLLALAKVYLDYFYPNAYAHYGVYATLDGIMQRQVTYTLAENELDTIFDALYVVSYNSDYFVSGFDNPVGPNDGVGSVDFNIVDVTYKSNDAAFPSRAYISNNSDTSSINNGNNGTPVLTPSYNNVGGNTHLVNISQYSLDSLKALTNYVRRHALAGSRALERYLADWGVALDADKLKRCYKISEKHFPVQVGDVMAQADTLSADGTSGAQLGDFAGRSVAFNKDGNFEFETSEFGYIIAINTIVPDIGYVQGLNRQVLHKTKLDFLDGNFDNLGTQPQLQCELFVGMKRPGTFDDIVSFVPRYAEYATCQDVLNGDFLFDTINGGLQGFELYRKWSDDEGDSSFDVTHSLDFVLGNDYSQYNRIFFDDEDDSDKFVFVHRFNFELTIPKKPLYDTYDFEEGKKILLDVNGSKTN